MKAKYSIIFLSVLLLSFGSGIAQTKELNLQEALQLAAKGNRLLQVQALENRKAEAAVKEVKSFLLPSVTMNAGYNVYGERPVIYLRNESSLSKVNDVRYGGRFAFDGNITATYPILNSTLQSNIRIAGITEQIRKQETKNTEDELALNIAQLYLSMLLNKEQQIVLKQSMLRNERALQDSRSLFLQGKNLKTDTLSNYISVQNLKASISLLENNKKVMSVQFNQLLGLDDSTTFDLKGDFSGPLNENNLQDLNTRFAVAIDNRKDVKIRSLEIEQSKELKEEAIASYKPQLWAIAQYQVQSQTDDFQFWNSSAPRTSFAGVRLSIPLYSGNRLKYKTAQSELSIKQNELALTELKSSIQTELVSLNANLQHAYNQWQIQQENVNAAQINYAMMNDRYHYGLGNRLELTDAELALTNAKLQALQSVFSIRLIEIQINKAMGLLSLN